MKLAFLTRPRYACFVLLASVVMGASIPAARSPSGEPQRRSAAVPQYNEKGELKRPTDYRTWVFVGTNIGLQYRPDAAKETTRQKADHKAAKLGAFHNVYINPEAHANYLKTGKFPDKTTLILDIYKAEERDRKDIVSAGLFPGKQLRIEVAVKNSARPDGSKTDWAYYDFALDQPAAKAFPDRMCYQCHRTHAADDNVWVQFYPTLRMHKKSPGITRE